MKSLVIARYTFHEILKSRIIYSTFFLGGLVALISYLMQEFTYGNSGRVALDFGIGLLTLSSVSLGIFFGTTLISKEVRDRTIYMTLSRSVSRTEYFLGKILGLFLILVLNIFILSLFSLAIYIFQTNESISYLLYWSIGFAVIEASIIMCVSILFSLITNIAMTSLYSIAVYVLGHALTNTTMLGLVKKNEFLNSVLNVYSFIFPNFSRLNIKGHLLHSKMLDLDFLLANVLYGGAYILGIIMCSLLIFKRKELK